MRRDRASWTKKACNHSSRKLAITRLSHRCVCVPLSGTGRNRQKSPGWLNAADRQGKNSMSKSSSADAHLLRSASANAERAALSLFAVASAVYPGNNQNLVDHFIREAVEAGIEPGLHARKVVELCHLEDACITQTRWNYEVGSRQRERPHFTQRRTDLFMPCSCVSARFNIMTRYSRTISS